MIASHQILSKQYRKQQHNKAVNEIVMANFSNFSVQCLPALIWGLTMMSLQSDQMMSVLNVIGHLRARWRHYELPLLYNTNSFNVVQTHLHSHFKGLNISCGLDLATNVP